MLVHWTVAAAAASLCPEPLVQLWPPADGSMAPDDWILTNDGHARLVDGAGNEVPLDRRPLQCTSLNAYVPSVPLTPGAPYTLNGRELRVEDRPATPPEPPILAHRRISVSDPASDWSSSSECSSEDEGDVEYRVCSDALVLVAVELDRPPTDLAVTSLSFVGVGPGIDLWDCLYNLAASPGPHTVWFGAMNAQGDIAWAAEPDTFDLPAGGWTATVDALGTDPDEACPEAFVGWGEERLECSEGCETADTGRVDDAVTEPQGGCRCGTSSGAGSGWLVGLALSCAGAARPRGSRGGRAAGGRP